jgi:hypothetical protein
MEIEIAVKAEKEISVRRRKLMVMMVFQVNW